MEHASQTDRFRVYDNLISLHLRAVQLIAEGKSAGQRLNPISSRAIEETYRPEAERLLAAFEVEAKQVPTGHWVYDDLEQAMRTVFEARHVLNIARQLRAEGNLEPAKMVLGITLHQDKIWLTAEERFEISALLLDLYLLLLQVEEAKLARFAAHASPEDPVHEMVRYWTARLQQAGSEEEK